ncbi:MAG TPA: cyclic pyranopterin monophosphate synthase MoaC [Spirochaetota bacterium]|nr:cyclic pyranopterin monophosphate synthase MoaC [Spirochaetota bacterium]
MHNFSHYNDDTKAVMVDVADKAVTVRTAKAYCFVRMNTETVKSVRDKLLPKGEPFEVARVAGIMAAKRTSDLIPMCHPLQIHHVNVSVELDVEKSGVSIFSEIRLEGKTGAEMEALTAAAVAALTVYDMCKAVDKGMIIEECRLLEKRGGKSDYSNP